MKPIHVINAPAQSGKTTELIKLAAKDWLYIVCINHARARYTFEMARSMGLKIPFPITFDDFRGGQFFGHGINGFLIDDLDEHIRYMARGVPVVAVTFTSAPPGEMKT